MWENSNCKCDNSKTQIVTQTKMWEKIKNLSADKTKNSNYDLKKKNNPTGKAQKHKL